MAEETSLEQKVAELSKQIQDQSRFTRAIVLVCTAATMGVAFWTVVQIFSLLPAAIVLQYMNNMPNIVAQWKFYESNQAKVPPSKTGTQTDSTK